MYLEAVLAMHFDNNTSIHKHVICLLQWMQMKYSYKLIETDNTHRLTIAWHLIKKKLLNKKLN